MTFLYFMFTIMNLPFDIFSKNSTQKAVRIAPNRLTQLLFMQSLVNWENGRSFPTMPQIEEICALYGVSVDNLIFLHQNNAKSVNCAERA